jgi:hypothetical protein
MNTIQQIAHNLRTQDNRATAHPVYLVQQLSRQYGIDPDYSDDTVWISAEDEADEQEAAELDKLEQTGNVPSGWYRTGYVDSWQFVTACLTLKGAQDFIAQNQHNLKNPRIYVASACQNNEIIELRKFLMENL